MLALYYYINNTIYHEHRFFVHNNKRGINRNLSDLVNHPITKYQINKEVICRPCYNREGPGIEQPSIR